MPPSMQFSDSGENWQPVPAWADFLIRFGFSWPNGKHNERRIALLSMPCESAGAGLVALGLLIRDLGNPRANVFQGHRDALLRYARHYIEEGGVSGKVRNSGYPNKIYQVSDDTNLVDGPPRFYRGNVVYEPNPGMETDWYLDGETAPEYDDDDGDISVGPYRLLIPESIVLEENLKRSYAGLCFAGRSGGEIKTRAACASIRFSENAIEGGLVFHLDDLLTINSWSGSRIARVLYFNSITSRADRYFSYPEISVADGDTAFLKILDKPEFKQSDVIGIISRTNPRDRLEAIGNKLMHLGQWYEQDEELLCELPPVPRGISISILKKRALL